MDAEEVEKLRSAKQMVGYSIKASDGELGVAKDFYMDDGESVVRYVVVDLGNWLPGEKALISKDWVKEIVWNNKEVFVSLAKGQVKDSPRYNPNNPVNREYETVLYDYYGRPHYSRKE